MMTNPITSKRPANLGVHQGKLAVCPATHNCVCSQADDKMHYVAPLSPADDMSGKDVLRRLASALHACEEAEVITQTDDYLHAECHSVMGFVDDLEFFWSPEENVCHVRSASRLGMSDLGKNRARVEKLRMLLEGWGFCD